MRVGIAQIHTQAGAFDQTVERMVALSQGAAERGVELLVFPLAALAGVEMVPYADRPSFMRDVASAVDALAERLACPALVPVPVDLGDDEGSFDVLLVQDGELHPLRILGHLQGLSDAQGPAPDVPEFSFGGLRWALALTHDELDALADYDYDVDAVLFVSGYPFALDDASSALAADLENGRYLDDARATGAWMVAAAPVGGYGDLVFSGASFVMAPTGELVASAPSFEEMLLTADVTPGAPQTLESQAPEVFDAPFHLWQAVTAGIRDYVLAQGRQDVALVLDGSIASHVLAALATDALGPLHVHALVGASAGARAPESRELVRRLRIGEIAGPGALPGLDPRDLDELALAAFVRQSGAVALSSADKTGLALGLWEGRPNVATLCPLGDVYRSDVLDMAHVRNTISVLFRRVELRDADALALTLPDGSTRLVREEWEVTRVDEILLGYIEYDRPLAELVADVQDDTALVEAVLRTQRAAEYQRRALPPVLAMSTHTLDDARFPLGVCWHDAHADAPDPFADLAAWGEQGEQPTAERGRRRHAGADIEGTLAMLRDLAEQGGFMPAQPPREGGADGGHPGGFGLPGMESPFSEN